MSIQKLNGNDSVLTVVDRLNETIDTVNGLDLATDPSLSFSTIVVNGTSIQADSPSDTLTITSGVGITLTPNVNTDSINIALDESGKVTAYDEGVELTTHMNKIDFVGDGVNATHTGNKVTVTITKTTKQELGLDLVDNTRDVDKVVSNPTQLALDNKVDKVVGKGLSTNDYTNTDKAKVDALEATITTLQNQITALNTRIETLENFVHWTN